MSEGAIKLWGRATSSNVMKVVWLLEELGLKYERIDLGGSFGGTQTEAYRAMNPIGLIPALQEGDFTLFESNAILRYICNAHAPHTSFYPQSPKERAVVEAWMDFQQTALSRHQSLLFQGLIRTAPEKRDHAVIATAIQDASKIWAILDARLALHPYVCGEEITLADFAYGPHIHRWFNLSFERPDAPHLLALYQRLLERPAFKAHCAGPVV
jgi:glutathione S-transferase